MIIHHDALDSKILSFFLYLFIYLFIFFLVVVGEGGGVRASVATEI